MLRRFSAEASRAFHYMVFTLYAGPFGAEAPQGDA